MSRSRQKQLEMAPIARPTFFDVVMIPKEYLEFGARCKRGEAVMFRVTVQTSPIRYRVEFKELSNREL